MIKKVRNTVPWTDFIIDLKEKEIFGTFYEKKNCQNQIKKSLEFEKIIKIKRDKLYVTLKGCNISFNSLIDKKDIVQMSKYFTKPKSLGANLKVQLDSSNYVTKVELKNAIGVDTSHHIFLKNLIQLI